ncbi:MAG: 6,7-dimethyl-8-ribityllumazine synthase, partial [Ktedonobacteraceae bacterium]
MDMSIPTPIEEPLDGRGLHIGIIVARYNWHITGALMQIAQKELVQMGVEPPNIRIILVPGAYE